MVYFVKPTGETTQLFLKKQALAAYAYPEVGATAAEKPMSGYSNDDNRVLLGSGEAVYRSACEALRQWRMFPGGWAWIEPAGAPIEAGQNLAMVARVMGMYWLNACRIAYTLDGTGPCRRFGFAYGTLPDHAETGEERFCIEWLADGTVWYTIKAFSRPRHWLAKIGKPLARAYQRRFVRQSLRKMRQEIQAT